MTATFHHPTPTTLRRQEAEQMGDFAGREYRNLIDDHSWDGDTWQELIAEIRVNPYNDPEPGMDEAERVTLHGAWKVAFDQGDHKQAAENNRAGTVTP